MPWHVLQDEPEEETPAAAGDIQPQNPGKYLWSSVLCRSAISSFLMCA